MTQTNTTASTTKKSFVPNAKSMGEDSIKRLIKKNKPKANSRPNSGNRKKQQTSGYPQDQ
eukprot:CAMPEP_0170542164 /NCGR_PEP_ID=MMETSP0211-20121228/1676_1 /TAXON_ID=311385 /ORGANISM="Pseudokeronopsis sp., Strain OXSARD2" /LENGTH=59 /DNA_ID=CAMNT_0010845137 /DNA_START=942 /DNA_END=1121 /DNA_ORIENTATION=-